MKKLSISLLLMAVVGLETGCFGGKRTERPRPAENMTYAERFCFNRGYEPGTQVFADCVTKKEEGQAIKRQRRGEREDRMEQRAEEIRRRKARDEAMQRRAAEAERTRIEREQRSAERRLRLERGRRMEEDRRAERERRRQQRIHKKKKLYEQQQRRSGS